MALYSAEQAISFVFREAAPRVVEDEIYDAEEEIIPHPDSGVMPRPLKLEGVDDHSIDSRHDERWRVHGYRFGTECPRAAQRTLHVRMWQMQCSGLWEASVLAS